MEIKKCLYVTDAPAASARLEALLPLCRLGLKEILCIVPARGDGGQDKAFQDRGVKCETLVVDNLTAAGILSKARETSASLIAADLKRVEGRFLNRSLARGLIRGSRIPILVAPDKDAQRTGNEGGDFFNSGVLAVEREKMPENLLHFIMELRGIIKELEIVNVIDRKLSIRDMIGIKDLLEETREDFMEKGTDAEVHIYAGKPADEILLAVRDYGVKAIIMGAGQPSRMKNFFYRGCSFRVAEKTVVPTFIVP
ncbi:MAG: universal stress protein [Pseudomonadota bacterium]